MSEPKRGRGRPPKDESELSQEPRNVARRARARAAKQSAGATPPPAAGGDPLPGLDDADPQAPVEVVPGLGSLPPADAPARGWRDRLWQRPQREPAKRGPRRKRESTAELLGMIWAGAGWGAVKLGDEPVGRAMQFQAAAAGPILERATADTPLDLLLQPLARNAEAWKDAGALLALPVFVAIMERSPELAIALEPLVRDLILTNAAAIVPVLERRQADEEKRAAALERLGIGGVDEILGAIFAANMNAQTAGPAGPAAATPGPNGAGEFGTAPAQA